MSAAMDRCGEKDLSYSMILEGRVVGVCSDCAAGLAHPDRTMAPKNGSNGKGRRDAGP